MPIGFKGHKRATNKDHLQALSHQRHGPHLKAMKAFAPPAAYDSRTKGIIGPIKDQSQCGSCWDFSGTCVVEVALYLAGVLKPDGSQALSEEYTLSCGKNGGCDGDDNTTVLAWAKATGLPMTSDYGPYDARADRCNYKQGVVLHKVDDWGFSNSSGDQGQNVTPTPDIKNTIITYGCAGCAVAAGGDQFWDSGKGIGSGSSDQIDHDVALVGWDDSKGKNGAWIMRNSWGASWGDGGYAWVEYGAYSIGTEAVFAVVKSVVPPAPPWIFNP